MSDWLKELDRLEREATPAPWEAYRQDHARAGPRWAVSIRKGYWTEVPGEPAAMLVTALRNHARELIDKATVFERASAHWLHPENQTPWEGDLADAVKASIDENQRLRAENAKLRKLLRRAMQYVDNDECFACNEYQGCAPDCELVEALK